MGQVGGVRLRVFRATGSDRGVLFEVLCSESPLLHGEAAAKGLHGEAAAGGRHFVRHLLEVADIRRGLPRPASAAGAAAVVHNPKTWNPQRSFAGRRATADPPGSMT
jgi:hypothetical protein